mmetsp:Transcript_6806/g.13278  ORF Transcript_6806/g.13278 Transcript_6806/m.13278 type:complete len:375 (+) Transcript_6806:368-1492(+)
MHNSRCQWQDMILTHDKRGNSRDLQCCNVTHIFVFLHSRNNNIISGLNESHLNCMPYRPNGTLGLIDTTQPDDWMDTAVQHKLLGHLRIGTEWNNGHVRPIGGDISGQGTARRQHKNSLGIPLGGSRHSRLGQRGFWNILRFLKLGIMRRNKILPTDLKLLSTLDDIRHHLHRIDGILALRGLSRKHDSICTIVDGIRNIGNLCTGWSGILSHTFQHLGGNNYGLTGRITRRDHFLLSIRYRLDGNFHSKIAPSNHDTIRLLQNLIKVLHSSGTLDLTNNQRKRHAVVPPQLLSALGHVVPNFPHPIGILNERRGHEVNILGHSIPDIDPVLIGHGGQVGLGPGEVHPGPGAELTGIIDGAGDGAVVDVNVRNG